MSWEDQGRQEHGWFGNGTAPLKDGAGEAGGGLLALTSEELDARIRSAIEAARRADEAAARAYEWAKAAGPALFGLPRSGALLEEFAQAVRRIEQARPGSTRQALDSWLAERAQATKGDGVLTPVRFTKDFDYACRVLRLDSHAASDALHAAKDAHGLGGANNCHFDLKSGDILFNGEVIGNLGD